jgi:hypothetical protein
MTIYEFFDPYNMDHIEAYQHLGKTGHWPEGFLPENIEIAPLWQIRILEKLANAWIDTGSPHT